MTRHNLIASAIFCLFLVTPVSAQYSVRRSGEIVQLEDARNQTVVVSLITSVGNVVFEMKVKGNNVLYFPFASVDEFKRRPARTRCHVRERKISKNRSDIRTELPRRGCLCAENHSPATESRVHLLRADDWHHERTQPCTARAGWAPHSTGTFRLTDRGSMAIARKSICLLTTRDAPAEATLH